MFENSQKALQTTQNVMGCIFEIPDLNQILSPGLH